MKDFKLLEGYKVWSHELNELGDDPHNPDYYNSENFKFVGVTKIKYLTDYVEPHKQMIYRSWNEGILVSGEWINRSHPMFNYPIVINEEDYYENIYPIEEENITTI